MTDNPVQGDSATEKRHATLRCRAASLSATACRASFRHHGGPAGEEAP
ncbi:DUF6380 family protein [Streptomyces caeni]|uniref:DUF6380 family protein n=1 Tax=Streptomyces caeni TaxID=2307231 RepID=A0ABW4ILT6_9ACTN